MERLGYDFNKANVRIEERSSDGITLAYGLVYSDLFKEWTFISVGEYSRRDSEILLGTCIEGIRVEFNSPGFDDMSILSIANVTGKRAPKTNVARSSLETGKETEKFLESIYQLYSDHVTNQIEELKENKHYSLTWAIREAYYIMEPLASEEVSPKSNVLLTNSLSQIPCIVIEDAQTRKGITAKEAIEIEELWTIDSELYRIAEHFLKEISSDASINGLLHYLQVNSDSDRRIFCGYNPYHLLHSTVLENRMVDKIVLNSQDRRLGLRWKRLDSNNSTLWKKERITVLHTNRRGRLRKMNTFVQTKPIGVETNFNPENYFLIVTKNQFFFPYGNPLNKLLNGFILKPKDITSHEKMENYIIVKEVLFNIILHQTFTYGNSDFNEKLIARLLKDDFSHFSMKDLEQELYTFVDKQELLEIMHELKAKTFDNTIWQKARSISSF